VTIHRIRLLGDPVLRELSEPIAKPRSAAVRVIADDLRETLRDFRERHGFGRGIAAPQIGAPVRIHHTEIDDVAMTMVNPEILDIGTEDFTVWDDCFSIPDLMVRVQRAYRIKVRWQDLKGETFESDFVGDKAELLQHEIDHLDGILVVDHPYGLDPFCLRAEWQRYHSGEGRYGPAEQRQHNYATPISGLL
jgi:peptide deformylase